MTADRPEASSAPPFQGKRPRILPPVWLLLSLLVMYALDRWMPVAELPRFPILGAALVVAGLTLAGWAVAQFLRARTGLIPFSESTTLVTGGMYRVTRNPMYLGMALLLAGGAVLFASLSPWLAVPAFALVIQRQFIIPEERILEGIYGEEYRAYCRRVRRWL